jgi:integrase
VKNVQARLGHTNIQTTLQTYVHDTEKMAEQSVELFEQITRAKTS